MIYKNIHTIRYMGNKGSLLDSIIPEIENITKPGDVICDIMAGTNSIGYALKERNIIYSNDIQFYSYVVGRAMLSNYIVPTAEEAKRELESFYLSNLNNPVFNFFYINYADTYFSKEQCLEIDSLRFAISNVRDENRYYLYLTCLMSAMCKAQSTTGHFAQYLPKDHKRVENLRKLSIYMLFFEKLDDFKEFTISPYENKCFNLDYNILFKNNVLNNVECFYLDSPYTHDQYSRFYHVLETVCKYDNPKLEFKGLYRNDRPASDFCYNKKVSNEFEKIISFCADKNASLIISYSNHGVISIDDLLILCKKHYDNVKLKYFKYNHSSQGKGSIKIDEVLFIMKRK